MPLRTPAGLPELLGPILGPRHKCQRAQGFQEGCEAGLAPISILLTGCASGQSPIKLLNPLRGGLRVPAGGCTKLFGSHFWYLARREIRREQHGGSDQLQPLYPLEPLLTLPNPDLRPSQQVTDPGRSTHTYTLVYHLAGSSLAILAAAAQGYFAHQQSCLLGENPCKPPTYPGFRWGSRGCCPACAGQVYALPLDLFHREIPGSWNRE